MSFWCGPGPESGGDYIPYATESRESATSASDVLYILFRRLDNVKVRLAKAVQRRTADAETSIVSVRGRRRVLKVVYPLFHWTSVVEAGAAGTG